MFMGICFIILTFLSIIAVAWLICVVQIERHNKLVHYGKSNMKKLYTSLVLMLFGALWLVLSFFVQTIGQEVRNIKEDIEKVKVYSFSTDTKPTVGAYCLEVSQLEALTDNFACEPGQYCLLCDRGEGKFVVVQTRESGWSEHLEKAEEQFEKIGQQYKKLMHKHLLEK